jgi:ligand-binding sensor domain-containing protein/two-component sensor histidine kinase
METFLARIHLYLKATMLLFLPIGLSGQEFTRDFIRYTFEDGLSDDYAATIWQDDRGYIWIGTENGLNRYDGHQFEHFFQDMPAGFLQSSVIHRIEGCSNHRFAILTANQVTIVSQKDLKSHQLYIPDTTAYTTTLNKSWDVLEIPHKGIALTTATGFYVFDVDDQLIYSHSPFTKQDVGKKRMLYGRNMLLLPDNTILVYIEHNQQGIYDPVKNEFHFVLADTFAYHALCHPSSGLPLINTAPLSTHEFIIIPQGDSLIYCDYARNKRVASAMPFYWGKELTWRSRVFMLNDSTFAINGGLTGFYLFHIQRQTGVITGNGTKYFNEEWVNAIFNDSENRLWIGTSDGLWKENLNKPFIHTTNKPIYKHPVKGTSNEPSIGFYYTGLVYKNKLYAGRYGFDNGLIILDPNTMEIEEQITFFPGKQDWNKIFSMQVYYQDTIWLGTQRGIIWFDVNTKHYGNLEDIHDDLKLCNMSILAPRHEDGYAWMSGYMTGVAGRYHIDDRRIQIFDEKSEPRIPFYNVKNIAYDSEGDVWLGGHSLARWSNKMQQFDTLITVYGGPNKYNENIIVMEADPNGSLWLSNFQNGLLQYKIRDREWVHYGLEQGISSTALQTMSPVVNNHIWVSDPHHLNRVNVTNGLVESYDQTDGLAVGRSESRSIYHDNQSDMMYLFLGDEISTWPGGDPPADTMIGQLICQHVQVNQQKDIEFPTEELYFKHKERNLTITYTLIDFEAGPRYQFAYRLNDAEPWTEIGRQRKIHLVNLPSGHYQLQVKARSHTGIEKTHHLSFIIQPPFWQRTWFIGVCLVVFLISTAYLYKRRITNIRGRANLDKQLSRAEMKALHAQMNPHFIFNSLNSIRKMVMNEEPREASRYLSKFAHLIRMTLEQSDKSMITLRETMDYLQLYVELEKIRNEVFACKITADEALDPDDTMLPPMLIQPLIENALWHGITEDWKAIEILVHFERRGNLLVCTVDDNGIGILTSRQRKNHNDLKHSSKGLQNTYSRIELLSKKHGVKNYMEVIDKSTLAQNPSRGTLVILKLPFETLDT